MMRIGAPGPVALALAGALALGACRGGGGDRTAAADSATVDTTNNDPMDGLSGEQIEQQAKPISPDQAAKMGMDTTADLEEEVSDVPPSASDDTAKKAAPDTSATRKEP